MRLLVLCLACLSIVVVPAASEPWLALAPDAQNGADNVTPVDLEAGLAGSLIETPGGASALGVAIGPDARTAYVVDAETHNITPIQLTTTPPAAGTPVDLTGSPAPANTPVPLNIAITPNGHFAYVPDSANSRVIPVDLTGTEPVVGKAIAVGGAPQGIAISPDGGTAYVANFADGTVTPISLATNTAGPVITGVGSHPYELAITPDGKTAYVTDNGSDKVYPISLPAGTVGKPISVGEGPLGIAITPDGSKAYVANFGPLSGSNGPGSTVTPIDLANNEPLSPISVGGGPWAVAAAPDGKSVYVTNSNDGSVTPIDVATNTAGTPFTGVPGPRSVAITPDQAPVANFTVASAPAGSATTFDASSSTVTFGAITNYAWEFGDGATANTAGPTVSHTYSATGTYTATVTETDTAGTSTGGEVFTGQTAVSVGGSSARTSRSVLIANSAAPAVTLSVGSLNFGVIGVGASASQTLKLTNTGTAPLSITSSSLSGLGAAAFTRGTDDCTAATIAPAASCSVTVRFNPLASGTFSAQLAFIDDASGSPHTVSLSGTGETRGQIGGHVVDGATTPATPVVAASVQICPRTEAGIALETSACKYARTDSAGAYNLAGLPPGTFGMQVEPPSPGLYGSSAIVPITAGAQTQDFTLTPPKPLGHGLRFETPSGERTEGVPTVNWNEPFAVNVPVNVAAHGKPNGGELYFAQMKLGPNTGGGVGDAGFAFAEEALFTARYDNAGNLSGISEVVAGSTALPGASASVASSRTAHRAGGSTGDARVRLGPIDFLTQTVNGASSFSLSFFSPCDLTGHPFRELTFWTPRQITGIQPPVTKNAPFDVFVNTEIQLGTSYLASLPNTVFTALDTDAQAITTHTINGANVLKLVLGFKIPKLDEVFHGPAEFVTESEHELWKSFTEKPNASHTTGAECCPSRRSGLTKAKAQAAQVALGPHIEEEEPCPANVTIEEEEEEEASDSFEVDEPFEGGVYVDPSGTVHTRLGRHPIAGARVTLLQIPKPGAHAVAVRNGSAVMSPRNRRNPDRTDAFGSFGWDVLPGTYRVSASHPGCYSTTTPILTVPPPALGLSLDLNCPRVRYAPTSLSLRATRAGGANGGTIFLRIRVLSHHGHPLGIVTLRSRGRILAEAAVNARTGLTTLPLPAHGLGLVTATYSGDGLFAPSRRHAHLG